MSPGIRSCNKLPGDAGEGQGPFPPNGSWNRNRKKGDRHSLSTRMCQALGQASDTSPPVILTKTHQRRAASLPVFRSQPGQVGPPPHPSTRKNVCLVMDLVNVLVGASVLADHTLSHIEGWPHSLPPLLPETETVVHSGPQLHCPCRALVGLLALGQMPTPGPVRCGELTWHRTGGLRPPVAGSMGDCVP